MPQMTTDSRAGEDGNLYITVARMGINMAAWKQQQQNYLLQVVLNWSAREQEEELSFKLRVGGNQKDTSCV